MRRLLSVLVWASLLAMVPSVRAAVCVAGQPSTAGNAASSAVTSLTLANPGSLAGDVLLVQLVLGDDSSCPVAGCPPPSGWTIYSTDRRGDKIQTLLYHVAGASEPASYTFNFGSARAVGGLLMLRGVEIPGSGNPITQVRSNQGTGTTLTALSADVASGNSLVVRAFAWDNGNDVLSGPATQHYTMATGAGPNGVAASASSAERVNPGPSGDATATAGGNFGNWLAVTTVLAPGSGGGGICDLAQVDHYELVYASHQALTCNPLAVTVRACANSSCSTLYGSPTSTTLSATDVSGSSVGNWSSNPLSFTGSGNSNYRLTTPGLATLGISSASPTASNPLRCSSDNCRVLFADSGFILDVPNLLAAKPTQATLQAVRKDDASQACVPGFASGTRSVQFSRSYSNPATGTQPVVVNGTAVSGATPVALTFDASASATLAVRYDDAGEMTLSASYTGSGEESGLLMSGSDNFVSKPYGLLLQSDTDSSCTASIGCPLFPGGVRAGDPFSLRIKAVAWQSDGEPLTAAALADNLVTPNFRLGDIPLSSQVQAPAAGSSGTLGLTRYDHALGNQTELASQAISEVGVFRLTATPAANAYLGETVSASQSGLVGRFAPKYFDVQISQYEPAECVPGGGTPALFVYAGLQDAVPGLVKAGQPFQFAGSVTARNAGNAETLNYDRDLGFSRLEDGSVSIDDYEGDPPTLPATPLAAEDGVALITNSLTFEGGVSAINLSGEPSYQFNAPRDAYRVSLVVRATDTDLVTGTSAQTAALDFRLGQARIGNAHGSELQELALPFTAAYFNGSGYVANLLDNCSVFKPASLGAYQRTGSGSGSPTLVDRPYQVALGAGSYLLSAPGADSSGSAPLIYDGVPSWLQFDWNGDGVLDKPSGLATFGIYKGAAPLIFRRELYR